MFLTYYSIVSEHMLHPEGEGTMASPLTPAGNTALSHHWLLRDAGQITDL